MKISIMTLFPKMILGFFEESIVQRAQNSKLVEIELINIRDFAIDDYGTVDDKPYGGGVGMVMKIEPIYKALKQISNFKFQISNENLKSQNPNLKKIPKHKFKIILTSPKGKKFTQEKAMEYSKFNQLVIIAGHYEGVDERVGDLIDEEISLGDFVLTGGEIVASAIVDSVVRLIPGVLKKEDATKIESFYNISIDQLINTVGGNKILLRLKKKGVKLVKLLEYPQYTRPENFMRKKVPEVLLSGHHKEIEKWQIKKAYEETLKKRPDLLS